MRSRALRIIFEMGGLFTKHITHLTGEISRTHCNILIVHKHIIASLCSAIACEISKDAIATLTAALGMGECVELQALTHLIC